MTIKYYHVGFIVGLALWFLISFFLGIPDHYVGLALSLYIIFVAVAEAIRRLVN